MILHNLDEVIELFIHQEKEADGEEEEDEVEEEEDEEEYSHFGKVFHVIKDDRNQTRKGG